jgi:hypothetical protein
MKYVIEANDPYTRRAEYLAGLDEVTRKALWTRAPESALQFASSSSAAQLAGEAFLGRVAQVAPASPPTMAERFVPLYAAWDEHCIELYARTMGGEREPDLWAYVHERDPDIYALSLYDAVPREQATAGLRRLVDVMLFDDGSSALRRYDEHHRAGPWKVS